MTDKKKILIVDDEASLRTALSDALLAEGKFEVLSATNGEEALEVIRKQHPALILLDISMPKMDGIQVAKVIHDEKLMDSKNIMFLTNSADIEQIASAIEVGGADYLIKADWDMKDILKRILDKMQ